MAKPSKDADRRARIEQMRREEKRKERRKSMAVVGASVAVGAVIVGAAFWQLSQAQEQSGRPLSELGVAAADAGCQDVTTAPAEGANDHRTEGERILYETVPPAAGAHWPQFLIGNQIRPFWTVDDRPAVERLLHSVEHGHTILWYDEDVAADEAEIAEVEALARKAAQSVGGKFMAAPWTKEDGDALPGDTRYVLTHWSMGGTNGNPEGQQGVRQLCTDLSGEVVEQFIEDYPPADSPEPNAA